MSAHTELCRRRVAKDSAMDRLPNLSDDVFREGFAKWVEFLVDSRNSDDDDKGEAIDGTLETNMDHEKKPARNSEWTVIKKLTPYAVQKKKYGKAIIITDAPVDTDWFPLQKVERDAFHKGITTKQTEFEIVNKRTLKCDHISDKNQL